jgi:hypothetical protein
LLLFAIVLSAAHTSSGAAMAPTPKAPTVLKKFLRDIELAFPFMMISFGWLSMHYQIYFILRFHNLNNLDLHLPLKFFRSMITLPYWLLYLV